jgi:PAS domain S-box-containing protein
VLPNVLPKVARLFGASEAHLLFAQGWHLGVMVLGNLDRPDAPPGPGMRLSRQDLQLLSPLTSGLAVILGNATQVAQIKEEKSTLEQILGLSSDGILLLDGKGRVWVWNQAMERITGVPADEAVGLPYNEWLAGHDHDGELVRLEELLAAATPASPRASAEVQIRTSEGLERWLRCNHSLLYEGGESTTDVVIVHDVTRIRQAERAKTDFVATVSHELRAPSPRSRVTWRSSRPAGPACPSTCVASAPTWPRRAGGRPPTGVAAPIAGSSWSCPTGPWRSTPTPLRLVQVLANLISNAHKYSPTDQEVRVRVWRDNGWALAAVADRAAASPATSSTGSSRSSTGSRTR